MSRWEWLMVAALVLGIGCVFVIVARATVRSEEIRCSAMLSLADTRADSLVVALHSNGCGYEPSTPKQP